jgi:polysaccharide chain length determinant protein (PEP-CTERM system associated)
MKEQLAEILSYVWGIWRFRWLALVVAWALALAGWLFVYQMPESYVATARIHVDSNNLLRPLLKGLTVQPNLEQRINMMSRTLLSRPNLEKVMRMTDLDLEIESELQKEKLLDALREDISLKGERGNESLYSIEVTDEDRDTARNITQALITVFIESSLSEKREDSSGAQGFLEAQIAEYAIRLEEAENRLAAFKQRHMGSLPGADGGYYERLDQARQELATAQLELRETQNRRRELERQIKGEKPVISARGEEISSPLDERIHTLNARLDDLLTRFTEYHPEVRHTMVLIDELEAQKKEAMELAMAGEKTPAGLSSSPIYQEMRALLSEAEAREAELLVRVAEYERRVNSLVERVNNIPVIEAEMKQLDRDYQVVATQHKELLERRESAKLSQDLEQNASDVAFRVVDPPFVPIKPSEPNKLLLSGVVLVLALGAGAALALLVSMIKPVVVDQQSLIKLTGLPLLGSVGLIATPRERRQETLGLAIFSLLAMALVAIYAAVSVARIMMLW